MPKRIPSILIIEDDLDTRDMLARLLSAEGYSVRLAANGWEGLIAMERPVDLILLDIMLPGMDGVTFLKSLRGQKSGRTVPVVVVTALDMAEIRPKVTPLGVNEIVSKGGNLLPQLKGTLKRAFEKPKPHARVELPEVGMLVRPYLDTYLKTVAFS